MQGTLAVVSPPDGSVKGRGVVLGRPFVFANFSLDAASAQVDARRIHCDGLPDPDTIQAAELETCLQQHFADIKQPVDRQFVKDLELIAKATDPQDWGSTIVRLPL